MTGSQRLFNTHTHSYNESEVTIVQLNTSESNLPEAFFSAGIHPKEASLDLNEFEKWMDSNYMNQYLLAIGEIGLDSRYSNTKEQEFCFIEQLKIAESYQKPVILHCVNSWDRCRFLHSKYAPSTTLIYHGFNKPAIATQVLAYSNAIVSIGASVLTNNALSEMVSQLPTERLLVETDDSSTPLISIYQKIADLKSLTLRDFKNQIDDNAKRIFRL